MIKYRVDVSLPAEEDLRDIVRYISSQLSASTTAIKMMETIEAALSELVRNSSSVLCWHKVVHLCNNPPKPLNNLQHTLN